jgi:hypothetical protein
MGTIVFLTIPYLALAVLTIVSLVALARRAWAIVTVPYVLSRGHQSPLARPNLARAHIDH